MVKNYYKILGLNKGATEDDIKKAYRKMALKFHPDKNKDSDAEERFKEIAEAYEVLSDNKKKYKYDNTSRRNSTPNNNHSWSFSFRPTDPFDLFKNFFNGVDPFSDGFHDSLFNLHRQHHNSIFGRDPFFSQSRDFPDTSNPFKPRNIGNVTVSSEVKTETSYKTGGDGTVQITRTVIGKDGTVSKEFRFRSTSCQNSPDEPKSVFNRQTSEPMKNNAKLNSISEVSRDFPSSQLSEAQNTNNDNSNNITEPEPVKETNFDIINSFPESEVVKPEEIKTFQIPSEPVSKPSSDNVVLVGHLTRKKSEKILEDLSNLVLKEAESLDEELSSLPQPGHSGKENKNETEKDCSKEQNIFLDQLSAPTNGDNYNSIYNIEAEVVKEKFEKSVENEETQDQVSLMEGKSSLDCELPATSFYQTSVPSPLAKKSQGGSGDTNSMLDFCISRSGPEQAVSRAKNVYKFQPQVRKPSLVRNRKKSYKRSKSYAGGTVSLSQCPLCARLFERSVIEEHAASCPGLCDTNLSEETTDRSTCPLCGQKFSSLDKLEHHAQYCGEVSV